MGPIHYALLLSLFAGLAIPLGGVLARVEHISNRAVEARFLKSITAFGGGALLSAVALVLVPKGAEVLPVALAVGLLVAGACVLRWWMRPWRRRAVAGRLCWRCCWISCRKPWRLGRCL
ncbi:hypothetical protein [Shimia sp. MIT910701]|uniref:hypothetical protein n=1 Tax=Shimia sp. MIT910701 TaxID=3096987 RepID=UPI00399C089F